MSENKPTSTVTKVNADTAKQPSFKLSEKNANMIFIGILILGCIIFTFIVFANNSKSTKYKAVFNEDIYSVITIKKDKCTLDVTVKDETITEKAELDLIDDGDGQGYKIYQAKFNDEVVQIKLVDDQLIMAYESGEIIIYEKE